MRNASRAVVFVAFESRRNFGTRIGFTVNDDYTIVSYRFLLYLDGTNV